MNIWLLNSQEQIPYLNSKRRPMRMGLIAKYAAQNGHQVTWWTSTFEHVSKQFIRKEEGMELVSKNIYLYWLSSIGYNSHLSIRRFINNLFVSSRFYKKSKNAHRPDLIIVSFPIPELAIAATRYGKLHNIPVVVDIRDWWPEAFIYVVPKVLRQTTKIAFTLYETYLSSIFKSATAITGITQEFVAWGVKRAKRKLSDLDKAFPHGYERIKNIEDNKEANLYWDKRSVKKGQQQYNIVFLGSITRSSDFDPIIRAARFFSNNDKRIRFIFCGAGDRLPSLREKTKDICNVLINGEWVDRAKIASLLTRAFIGLVPLPDRPDFLATINNKTIEYLSFGLPIIVSPERSKVARLARENGFGLSWDGYSSDQLINCIQKLIDSDVNYNKMSRAASTYFSENFNAEKVYSQYIEHIEQIAQAYNRT